MSERKLPNPSCYVYASTSMHLLFPYTYINYTSPGRVGGFYFLRVSDFCFLGALVESVGSITSKHACVRPCLMAGIAVGSLSKSESLRLGIAELSLPPVVSPAGSRCAHEPDSIDSGGPPRFSQAFLQL